MRGLTGGGFHGYLAELYEKARAQYGPQEVSPFVCAHHVVCALESENGGVYTGFCIESCSGVMDLCAERVAALNMYLQSGQTVVRRLIAFRDRPPYGGGSGHALRCVPGILPPAVGKESQHGNPCGF